MDLIGKKIREALEARSMSSSDLGNKVGLTKNTIENVIFGRSRKPSHIIQIEKALNIELTDQEGLIGKELSDNQEVDVEKLMFSFSLITKLLKKNNVYVSKNTVTILSNLLYEFYTSKSNITEAMLETYAYGMIDFGIKSCALSVKKK